MADEQDERKLNVIRVANFEKPHWFKVTQGAMHPYIYLPFLGWVSSHEATLFFFVLAIAGACSLSCVAKVAKIAQQRREQKARAEVRDAVADPGLADPGLIKRLGPNSYDSEPFRSPYVAVFERGGKRLVFIAGDHKDGLQSPVAKMLRWAFKKYDPKAVVVEGLSGDAPEELRKWLDDGEWFFKNKPGELAENYYPAVYAHQRGLPFAGGEPSRAESFAALKSRGYTAEDFVAQSAAANTGAYNINHPQTPESLAKALDGHLDEEAKALGLKGYSYADFTRWCRERAKLDKPAHLLDKDDSRPYDGPDAHFLQKMAYELELVRETSIVRRIETMLRRHDRVLVVYGSGHLVRQRDVWKAALGPSRDHKPF
jgi:hypothetical protein